MRICFVVHDRPGYAAGPIINMRRLLPELKRRGHAPSVLALTMRGGAPNVDALRRAGIRCRTLRWKPGYTERHVEWLLWQLKRSRPDVFVPNVSLPAYFAARAAREAGIPTIGTMRSDDAFHWSIVKYFVQGQQAWSLSAMVCVSDDIKRTIERDNPHDTRLCVIPSGVPLPAQKADPGGALRLVYVGRLVQEQKRILDVVRSMIDVLKSDPAATASLVGSGDEERAVRQLIGDESMEERITLRGTVPCEEIHAVLGQHNVLVQLSDYEGTPGAVMDGMACGLVPVCLDIPGGLRDLLIHERTGLLVENRDASFRQALARLKDSCQLREKLAAAARAHVAAHYSLEHAANEWEQLLDRLSEEAASKDAGPLHRVELPPVNALLAPWDRRERPMGMNLFRAVRRLAGVVGHHVVPGT